MNDHSSPEISVVIFTPDCYETIRKTIGCLRKQTVKRKLEIVIVVPSAEGLGLNNSELEEFFHFRVVEVGINSSLAAARAAGIRQAKAQVVVFAEDHSFPETGWAEALIEAHRGPWAAVGPAICNANPNSITSWAQLFMTYGRWTEPIKAGEIDDLPGHNSSYKRAILLDYGPELENKLIRETILHWDLRVRGYSLYLESAARTHHVNISRLSSIMQDSYHGARLFAATRASVGKWSFPRRLVYTFSEPFFALRRFGDIIKNIRRTARQKELMPLVIPVISLGLLALGLGEMMGYALGAANSEQIANSFEFHRHRFLLKHDQKLVT
jgi:glycosyltransferase involved in cell wall biosynthesis